MCELVTKANHLKAPKFGCLGPQHTTAEMFMQQGMQYYSIETPLPLKMYGMGPKYKLKR
jgi:hypothetical protein